MNKSPLPLDSICGAAKQVIKKEALVKLLRWHFGHSDFRGKQLEAIESVLSVRFKDLLDDPYSDLYGKYCEVVDELKSRLGAEDTTTSEVVGPKPDGLSQSSSTLNPVVSQAHDENPGISIKSDAPISQVTVLPPVPSFSEFINSKKATENKFSMLKKQSSDGVGRAMEKKSRFQ